MLRGILDEAGYKRKVAPILIPLMTFPIIKVAIPDALSTRSSSQVQLPICATFLIIKLVLTVLLTTFIHAAITAYMCHFLLSKLTKYIIFDKMI